MTLQPALIGHGPLGKQPEALMALRATPNGLGKPRQFVRFWTFCQPCQDGIICSVPAPETLVLPQAMQEQPLSKMLLILRPVKAKGNQIRPAMQQQLKLIWQTSAIERRKLIALK
jgi:hypothetical protein